MSDLVMESYQLQPGNILVVLQIISEVLAIHKFENEGKRMFRSGINPNERYETPGILVETTARQDFLVQPLPVTFSEQNTLRYPRHSPDRRVNSSTKNSTCTI